MKKENFLKTLLTIFLISTLISCKTTPTIEGPSGEACITAIQAGVAVCRDIKTRKPLRDRSINETDGWLTMPVSTFNSINDYIDRILEALGDKNLKLTPAQIKEIQTDMNLLSEDLQSEKRLL